MEDYHKNDITATPKAGEIKKVMQEWSDQINHQSGDPDFRAFELKLRRAIMAFERAAVAQALAALDIDCGQVKVGEKVFNKLEDARDGTYYSLAGEVVVKRHLYKAVGSGRPICPLDLRAGIFDGTPGPLLLRR